MKKSILLLFIVCLPLLAKAYDVEIDGIYYNIFPNSNYAEVTSGDSPYEGNIVIASSIEYEGVTYPVTTVGMKAFYQHKKLTSVVIPNSVSKIGNDAFGLCYNLISITIPSSVMEIGQDAFYYCDKLTDLTIPVGVKKNRFSCILWL